MERHQTLPILFVTLLAVIAMGCVPKYIPEQNLPPKKDNLRPIVERAERVVDRMRGQYVFASALLDAAQADLRAMQRPPENVRQREIKLKALQSASRSCWDEPLISTGRAPLAGYQLEQLASAFSKTGGRHEVPVVKTGIDTMVRGFSPCSGTAVNKARKLPRRTTEEAGLWVDTSLLRIHRLRVLANEVPGYWEQALSDIEDATNQVRVLRTKIERERGKPETDPKVFEKHMKRMNAILSTDLYTLEADLNRASEAMETQLILTMEAVEALLDRRPFLGVPR